MTKSVNETMLEMIMSSYQNDMAIFEAVLRSDARELAYRKIIKEGTEEGDKDKVEGAKDAAAENTAKSKKGLKETLSGLIEKITKGICDLLDKVSDAVAEFQSKNIKKFVAKHEAEYTKAIKASGFSKSVEAKSPYEFSEFTADFFKFEVLSLANLKAYAGEIKEDTKLDEFMDGKLGIKKEEKGVTISDPKAVLDFLKSDRVAKGIHAAKAEFKKGMDALLASANKEESEADASANYTKVANAYERASIRLINSKISAYKNMLKVAYKYFKQAANIKEEKGTEEVKGEEAKEEKAAAESAISNEFDFVWESCFEL